MRKSIKCPLCRKTLVSLDSGNDYVACTNPNCNGMIHINNFLGDDSWGDDNDGI